MPALLFLLCGCASIPDAVRELPDGTAVELDDTPFFPQQRYQCGPAALTTVLVASGVDASLETIVDKVYLPGRQGSLQIELVAAARTESRLPYVIEGTLAALLAELEAGRPVLVLQNLGIRVIPRWHYAVVVGIDSDQSEIVLRSGTDRRRVTPVDTFLRTWRRGEYWGMVALRPDEMPAVIDRERYLAAVAALEETGQLESAVTAWRTAEVRWPDDPVVLFGLANTALASGDYVSAESGYRRLLARAGALTAARNNLALALAHQGRFDEAMTEIKVALGANDEPRFADVLQDTLGQIQRMAERAQ